MMSLAVPLAVVATVGIVGAYATGVFGGLPAESDNVAEAAQTGMEMLEKQTDDLEDAVLEVASAPLGDLSSYDRSVTSADDFIADLQAKVEVPQTEYILTVKALKAEWDPRYEAARDDFERLKHRVRYAEKKSEQYFSIQFDLTEQINNAQLRSERLAHYSRQQQQYGEWKLQAGRMLAEAQDIMNDLNDMNIVIKQQELEAHFIALHSDFNHIPNALSSLHAELDLFRAHTADLNRQFENAQQTR